MKIANFSVILCLSITLFCVGAVQSQDMELSKDPNLNQLLNAVVVYAATSKVCENNDNNEMLVLVDRSFRHAENYNALTPTGKALSNNLDAWIKDISSRMTKDKLWMSCNDVAKQTPILKRAVDSFLGVIPQEKIEDNNESETSLDVLSKSDADQVFSLSYSEWRANVKMLKENNMGDYQCSKSQCTLLTRAPSMPHETAQLNVRSEYGIDKSRPERVVVTVIYDEGLGKTYWESIKALDVVLLFAKSIEELSPEYTVFGYLFRNFKEAPQLIFNIYQRGDFPELDKLSEKGILCPFNQNDESKHHSYICIRDKLIP